MKKDIDNNNDTNIASNLNSNNHDNNDDNDINNAVGYKDKTSKIDSVDHFSSGINNTFKFSIEKAIHDNNNSDEFTDSILSDLSYSKPIKKVVFTGIKKKVVRKK